MSEDDTLAAGAAGTNDDIQNQDTIEGGEGASQTKQSDPAVEDRARNMGWVPQEDYRGDPARWVDADTFVQRGEEIMPILKANLRKMEAENAEIKRTLKDLADHHTKTEQRMYAKALQDITAQQRQAAEAGDVATFDKLEQDKQAVFKDATQKRQNGNGQDVTVDPVAEEWAQRNRWFRENQEMGNFAATHHEMLLRTRPGLSLAENLEEVEKAVKRAYPEKFKNPRRESAQTVEGGTQRRGGGGKSYTDLPPDAKAACDRFVKQGVLTKEQYLKDYFAE